MAAASRRNRAPAAEATIREVARAAGVSVATVSRVLNGKGPVAAETSQRVRESAQRLQYLPHAAARSLITRRHQTMGVLLPDLYGEFFSELIRGIDLAARARGYHLLVSSSHSDARRGGRDGAGDARPGRRARRDAALGAARADRFPTCRPSCSTRRARRPSPRLAARRQPRRRARHGASPRRARPPAHRLHRRTARQPRRRRAAARLPRGAGRPRPRGERRARVRRRLHRGGWTRGGAPLDRPAASVRARSSPPTTPSRSASSPPCAAAGVAVPRDVALGGFDDIPLARLVSPPLTTVRVPIAELGARAVERLFAAVDGADQRAEDRPPQDETVLTQLIARASSAPPSVYRTKEREP